MAKWVQFSATYLEDLKKKVSLSQLKQPDDKTATWQKPEDGVTKRMTH